MERTKFNSLFLNILSGLVMGLIITASHSVWAGELDCPAHASGYVVESDTSKIIHCSCLPGYEHVDDECVDIASTIHSDEDAYLALEKAYYILSVAEREKDPQTAQHAKSIIEMANHWLHNSMVESARNEGLVKTIPLEGTGNQEPETAIATRPPLADKYASLDPKKGEGAVVSSIKGELTRALPDNSKGKLPITGSVPLLYGEKITAGPDSEVELTFPNGDKIILHSGEAYELSKPRPVNLMDRLKCAATKDPFVCEQQFKRTQTDSPSVRG